MKSRMDRRDFLVGTLTIGAGAASTLACRPESRIGVPAPAEQPIADFELDEVTVRGLQAAMEEGRLTTRGIAELYLARIEAIDKDGAGRPGLHSIIEVNPEALGVADSTVKTHLGNLYGKTGTSRQADLVRLVAGFANPLVA